MIIFIYSLSLIIIAEAVALFTGFYLMKKKPEWLSTRNIIFLLLDLITGFGIIYLMITGKSIPNILFSELLIAGVISHLLRSGEYFLKRKIIFCFNIPLFIINNIKLVGLLAVYILSFYLPL